MNLRVGGEVWRVDRDVRCALLAVAYLKNCSAGAPTQVC